MLRACALVLVLALAASVASAATCSSKAALIVPGSQTVEMGSSDTQHESIGFIVGSAALPDVHLTFSLPAGFNGQVVLEECGADAVMTDRATASNAQFSTGGALATATTVTMSLYGTSSYEFAYRIVKQSLGAATIVVDLLPHNLCEAQIATAAHQLGEPTSSTPITFDYAATDLASFGYGVQYFEWTPTFGASQYVITVADLDGTEETDTVLQLFEQPAAGECPTIDITLRGRTDGGVFILSNDDSNEPGTGTMGSAIRFNDNVHPISYEAGKSYIVVVSRVSSFTTSSVTHGFTPVADDSDFFLTLAAEDLSAGDPHISERTKRFDLSGDADVPYMMLDHPSVVVQAIMEGVVGREFITTATVTTCAGVVEFTPSRSSPTLDGVPLEFGKEVVVGGVSIEASVGGAVMVVVDGVSVVLKTSHLELAPGEMEHFKETHSKSAYLDRIAEHRWLGVAGQHLAIAITGVGETPAGGVFEYDGDVAQFDSTVYENVQPTYYNPQC